MFTNDATFGTKDVLSNRTYIPAQLFKDVIQGKSLEDFKALLKESAEVSMTKHDLNDEIRPYYLLIHVDGDKVSFSGTYSPDDFSEGLMSEFDRYNWTTPATIEEINEFTVEL